MIAAYIVPGLWGREPWSSEDASAFGVAWNMASGTSVDWWLPSIAGEPLPEEGPLTFWLGALFAKLLGPWLGQITAARLVTVFWFVIGTWALWYATYRLARRDEAQPVALAFGGEASPRDYGRMLAYVAVLFLTATFGVLVRFHETGAEPALLALVCITLFGLAFALDDPWEGTAVAGLAIGAIVLTRGWLPAVPQKNVPSSSHLLAPIGVSRVLKCCGVFAQSRVWGNSVSRRRAAACMGGSDTPACCE